MVMSISQALEELDNITDYLDTQGFDVSELVKVANKLNKEAQNG